MIVTYHTVNQYIHCCYGCHKWLENSKGKTCTFILKLDICKIQSIICTGGGWGLKLCIQIYSKNINILKFKDRLYTISQYEGICMIPTLFPNDGESFQNQVPNTAEQHRVLEKRG